MNRVIEALLERIYYYYPIGVPSLINSYEGQKEIRKIIEKKVNQIISKEGTYWASLVQDLDNTFPSKVFDMGYMQFASYIATIEMDIKNEQLFSFSEKIIINISLLCPYYTVYYEDRFVFKHGESEINRPNFRIFFDKLNNQETESLNNLNHIKKKVELFFPGYSFLNHKLLFDHTIAAGLPFSYDSDAESRSFPFYSFLFDPHLLLNNLEVK